MADDRDNGGRFRAGAPSPNPKGRPKKARGVDAAFLNALAQKVVMTEQGQRKRKSKLDITAAQIANKSAGGDLRAAKMALDQVRKAEDRAEAGSERAPIMTEVDRMIAARVIDRLKRLILEGDPDDQAPA